MTGPGRLLVRVVQIAVTFVLFAAANALAVHFEIESGVSILFPATAVGILACMFFGPWAALGIVLGTVATPWGATESLRALLLSGAISAGEALIPCAVFRLRKDLDRDLRDIRSLLAFLLFGTLLNTAFSAVAGNILVVPHAPGVWIDPHQVLVWFLADFTAALLLATPLLAFGGTLRRRLTREGGEERPRTLTNALQIVVVLILLGWSAAFAIRTYLLHALEDERFNQQQVWAAAEETINRMHTNFLVAAFVDAGQPHAAETIAAARRTHDAYVRQLGPLLAAASPELREAFPRIARDTARWFDHALAVLRAGTSGSSDENVAHITGRAILDLRGAMERANVKAWGDFEAKRHRIMIVGSMVDGLVLLVLLLTSLTLLRNVSRPFRQLRTEIAFMREGGRFDARRITSQYMELRTLADTLAETSNTLQRREEELRLQTGRAVAASKHKSDFLAKMSHELRTPLNSIIGFSDLLAEQEPTLAPEKRIAFLHNVSTSAQRLLELINDLLDIAKVESGKMSMHFEEIDVRAAVANSVASTTPLFARKRQRVEVHLPPEPLIVRADQARVEQVLLNLLSNANKFSPAGEPVEVRTSAEASSIRIEVRDHGIGISREDQARIFKDFEQIHATGPLSNGTGLGLALARRFVEAHGGEIAVESDLGAGATFRVILPRVAQP